MRKSMFTTKGIAITALLVAMSILLKSFLSIETQIFRISFYEIPLLILGIMVGPIAGFVGGLVTDIVHIIFSPFAFTFNFFTVATISWGFIPGLFFFRKDFSVKTIALVVVFTSIIAFTFNTLGIYSYYGMGGVMGGIVARLIVFVVKIPIDIFIVKSVVQSLYATTQYDQEVYTK